MLRHNVLRNAPEFRLFHSDPHAPVQPRRTGEVESVEECTDSLVDPQLPDAQAAFFP